MNERRTIGIAGLTLLAAAWLPGCPGAPPAAERFHEGNGSTGGTSSTDGGGGAASNACGEAETLFATSCGTCHDADNPAGGLDLVSPGLAARVVGRPALGSCGGILADPQHPEDSVLYDKLLEAPACGLRMPLGAAPLSAEEIACVRAWIAAQ